MPKQLVFSEEARRSLKRGVDKLKSKKLVIWMMTARDLYDHAEGWQPVGRP